jgi:predicted metal-dependent phosphoesterase TrpH
MADRLRYATADLHVHTALSPCASAEMTPPAIVRAALARGLDMIAICDHNSARNVAAVQEAAVHAAQCAALHASRQAGPGGAQRGHEGRLTVLAGMEISSAEEVHVLGLFPDATAAEAAGVEIRRTLPEAGDGYGAFFGEQPLMSADGRVLGAETAALALATSLELDAVVDLIKRHGGLAVAAHIDRKAFSVFSQLGFFPAEAGFDAIEVTRFTGDDSPRMAGFRALGLPITSSSDSHYLEDIGSAATGLTVAVPSFAEVALALAGLDGRAVCRA